MSRGQLAKLLCLRHTLFCCLKGFKYRCGNTSSPKHWSDLPATVESKKSLGRSNFQSLHSWHLKKPS